MRGVRPESSRVRTSRAGLISLNQRLINDAGTQRCVQHIGKPFVIACHSAREQIDKARGMFRERVNAGVTFGEQQHGRESRRRELVRNRFHQGGTAGGDRVPQCIQQSCWIAQHGGIATRVRQQQMSSGEFVSRRHDRFLREDRWDRYSRTLRLSSRTDTTGSGEIGGFADSEGSDLELVRSRGTITRVVVALSLRDRKAECFS